MMSENEETKISINSSSLEVQTPSPNVPVDGVVEVEEKIPNWKQRLWGFGVGVGLGAPFTFYWNWLPGLLPPIPYISAWFANLPPVVISMIGAAGGSANLQWLAEPTPVALPKNTIANTLVALITTLLASALVGWSIVAVSTRYGIDSPDPAIIATIQATAGGLVAYILRALVFPGYALLLILKSFFIQSFHRLVACISQCTAENDPEGVPINVSDGQRSYS